MLWQNKTAFHCGKKCAKSQKTKPEVLKGLYHISWLEDNFYLFYGNSFPGISGCFHLPSAGITGGSHHSSLNIFKLGLKVSAYYYYYFLIIGLEYKVMNLTMASGSIVPCPHSTPACPLPGSGSFLSFPKLVPNSALLYKPSSSCYSYIHICLNFHCQLCVQPQPLILDWQWPMRLHWPIE